VELDAKPERHRFARGMDVDVLVHPLQRGQVMQAHGHGHVYVGWSVAVLDRCGVCDARVFHG
jgi:hypothetical protein